MMAFGRPTRRGGSRGFTLIEAMVTISVAAVLLAVVVPSFRTFTYSQRVKSASFDLMSTLLFARSEAVKRRVPITVEAKSGNWKNGWDIKDGTTILRTEDEPKGVTVTMWVKPSSGSATAVTSVVYRLDGRLSATDETWGAVTADGNTALVDGAGRRCVRIDPAGSPRAFKQNSTETCP